MKAGVGCALLKAARMVERRCRDDYYHGNTETCVICAGHAAAIRLMGGDRFVGSPAPQSAGGKARAASLSPRKRKEIAKKAARARWAKR